MLISVQFDINNMAGCCQMQRYEGKFRQALCTTNASFASAADGSCQFISLVYFVISLLVVVKHAALCIGMSDFIVPGL